jgi:hypothetical protein
MDGWNSAVCVKNGHPRSCQQKLTKPAVFFSNNVMSFAIVFLGYLRGTWRYLRFLLITIVDFYYVINKLIILLYDSH